MVLVDEKEMKLRCLTRENEDLKQQLKVYQEVCYNYMYMCTCVCVSVKFVCLMYVYNDVLYCVVYINV